MNFLIYCSVGEKFKKIVVRFLRTNVLQNMTNSGEDILEQSQSHLMADYKFRQSKHLKGQLGPRVSDVMFLDQRRSVWARVSDVTFLDQKEIS